MKPKIKMESGEVQGYGGPGFFWERGIYDNRLLFRIESRTEGDAAVRAERERVKWEREWPSKEKFLAAVRSKPLASSLCSNCGKDTLEGGSDCLERQWCDRPACRKALESARAKYAEDQIAREADDKNRREADRLGRLAGIQEATGRAFHWRNGWYFSRQEDGSVRVMHHEVPTAEWLRVDITIPPNEWASIVSSVSADGETGERWNAAQDFHGRSLSTPSN